MVLPPTAKVITRDDLAKLADTRSKQWARRQVYLLNGIKNASPAEKQKALDLYQRWQDGATGRDSVVADPGRLAAALGYDAIADRDSAGRLNNVTVLNRGALLVHDPALDPATVTPTPPTQLPPPPKAVPTTTTNPAQPNPATSTLPVVPPVIKKKVGSDKSGKLDVAKLSPLMTNDGTGHDVRLAAVAATQGFQGKPTVVSKAQADLLLAAGGTELWRGLSDHHNYNTGKRKTGGQLAEEFRSGKEAYYGQGIYGNGIYMSTRRSTAQGSYSNGKPDSLLRIVLPADAKVIDYDQAQKLAYADNQKFQDKLNAAYTKYSRARTDATRAAAYDAYRKLQLQQTDRNRVLSDSSRWAAANGYDAVRKPISGSENYYVLLNRTAVAVEKGN